MDGNTEPVIAVIGYPIAGNPAQFALERALDAMRLDWRVFSFDVAPAHLATALDGLEVLGVRGVLIDATLGEAAMQWRVVEPDGDRGDHDDAQKSAAVAGLVDCLFRTETADTFVKYGALSSWLQSLTNQHAESLNRDIEKTIVIGDREHDAAWSSALAESTLKKLPRNLDKIAEADLLLIQPDEQGDDVELDLADWPAGDEKTLVIDLSDGHPDLPTIQSLGYKTVSAELRRIEILNACLNRWTLQQAPADVLREAIEEYLAV